MNREGDNLDPTIDLEMLGAILDKDEMIKQMDLGSELGSTWLAIHV